MSRNYIPLPTDSDFDRLPYAERKRIKDKDIATLSRAILKDQPDMTRTDSMRLATSLYENNQSYTPIHPPRNSTTEDTRISSTELNINDTELEMHVTQGLSLVQPPNSRFANLEKPVNGADNQTQTVTQDQPKTVVQKAAQYPTLGTNPNPTKDTVKRPYNPHGVELTDEQRIEAKRTVLEVYGKCINWQTAIEAAGINRATLNYWRSIGYVSKADIADAEERWRDFLRGELVKVAVIGVRQPLVHNGRIALEPDGSKSFINKRDMRVLIALAEKWLPEFQTTKKVDIVTHVEDGYINGVPQAYAIVIDTRDLNQQQFNTIRTIAVDIETQKQAQFDQSQGIIDAHPTQK